MKNLFSLFLILLTLFLVSCSKNDDNTPRTTNEAEYDLSQEFLISEYSTQFLTVTFEYSEENKLARIFRETTSVGNHLMYEFVYDETEENHGELEMIIQYKPHHEESCQGSVYPLYYVVEELSESNASFTCLRYDEEGNIVCEIPNFISYEFDGNLIKKYAIKYHNTDPTVFTFIHNADKDLEAIDMVSPQIDSGLILTVEEYDDAPRSDVLNFFGDDIWVFQQYFFPNKIISNRNPKKGLANFNRSLRSAVYEYDANGLVSDAIFDVDGFEYEVEKTFIPKQ